MPRFAAVDIGSNSVRMEAAEFEDGSPLRILASERQVTRLGASVFQTGRVSHESMDYLCSVLVQMAAIYKKLNVDTVRAVATAAIRDASNQQEFLARASAALETDIEIISGQEEARLIQRGVQSRWPHPKERFLIVDIGGGSAEIILSENENLTQAFSKPLGALRLQEMFLKSDPPKVNEIHRMEEYIDEKIRSSLRRVSQGPIDRVIGTSATASAVVCAANQIPRARRDEADRRRATTAQIRKLYRDACAVDISQRQKIIGIGPRRAEIIIPGTAVLLHVLAGLQMPALYYSVAGLRDGIIADLAARGVGKETSQLSFEQRKTAEEMAEHYGVSLRHARKVGKLVLDIFRALQPLHKMAPGYGKLLEGAAYLHDVGHYVSDTRHHKHSYYLVANSDMSGFNAEEREVVANLCRYHRRALPSQEHVNLNGLTVEGRRAVTLLHPLLRLADSLDRSHGQRVKSVECKIRDTDILVQLTGSSEADVDLEIWAAERLTEIFRAVYNKTLSVVRVA